MTNSPISIKQIFDSIDLKCITVPTCRTFENDLQAFIDDYCTLKTSSTGLDISGLTSTCLTIPTTYELKDILQLVLNNCATGTTIISSDIDSLITNLNLCDSDNWEIGDSLCLTLKDICNNPITEYSLKEMLQIMIRRIIALEEILVSNDTTITNLQTDLNNLTSRVDLIEANCCNTTVVTQLGALNTRLTIAETDIDDIQVTCCP